MPMTTVTESAPSSPTLTMSAPATRQYRVPRSPIRRSAATLAGSSGATTGSITYLRTSRRHLRLRRELSGGLHERRHRVADRRRNLEPGAGYTPRRDHDPLVVRVVRRRRQRQSGVQHVRRRDGVDDGEDRPDDLVHVDVRRRQRRSAGPRIRPLRPPRSGLTVTFTSATPAVCTSSGANGATITFVAEGTCTVNANQAGNGTYNAAPQVQQTFTVASLAPTESCDRQWLRHGRRRRQRATRSQIVWNHPIQLSSVCSTWTARVANGASASP